MPSVRANGITIAYETDGGAGGVPLVLVMGLGMPLVFLCREEGEEEARVDEDHGSRR